MDTEIVIYPKGMNESDNTFLDYSNFGWEEKVEIRWDMFYKDLKEAVDLLESIINNQFTWNTKEN